MPDHFEQAMQDIALRSEKNGGPTIHDVLLAMVASDKDSEESAKALAETIEAVETHVTEELKSNRQFFKTALKESMDRHLEWTMQGPLSRLEALEKRVALIPEEHERKHSEHLSESHSIEKRRRTDELETDYTICRTEPVMLTASQSSGVSTQTLQDALTTWRVGRWLIAALLIIGLGWGISYWATSCAENNALHKEQAIEQPSTTSTASP
jgi:hypothetical protein